VTRGNEESHGWKNRGNGNARNPTAKVPPLTYGKSSNPQKPARIPRNTSRATRKGRGELTGKDAGGELVRGRKEGGPQVKFIPEGGGRAARSGGSEEKRPSTSCVKGTEG